MIIHSYKALKCIFVLVLFYQGWQILPKVVTQGLHMLLSWTKVSFLLLYWLMNWDMCKNYVLLLNLLSGFIKGGSL